MLTIFLGHQCTKVRPYIIICDYCLAKLYHLLRRQMCMQIVVVCPHYPKSCCECMKMRFYRVDICVKQITFLYKKHILYTYFFAQ